MTTELAQAKLTTAHATDLEPIGFLDMILVLASRIRLLVSVSAGAALAGFLVSLLLPNMYTATAVIMPPQQPQSTANALLGQLGTMAAMGTRDIGLRNPADLYIGILGGRTIAENLTARFELKAYYGVKTATDARKKLARKTDIDSGKDSLIKISVEDTDPQRAADLANGYIDELQKANARLAVTESGGRRLFFERALQKERESLAAAELSLKTSQQSSGVVQLSGQTEAVMRSIAGMRNEIAAQEVALERMKSGATAQNPDVIRQETEVKELRNQLHKLEFGTAGKGSSASLLEFSKLPGAGLESLRRVRELQYHETLFELLVKQYEAARIDEAKEAPAIQVVDYAVPPELKSFPMRGIIAVVCGLLAGLFAVGKIIFDHLRNLCRSECHSEVALTGSGLVRN